MSVELKVLSRGARAVLDYLLKSGGGSQASLSAAADISQPQVARLIKGLQADGLIELTSRKTQRRGNPSVHVALNPDHAYGLGIAVTDDTVSVTILDLAGRVRASVTTAPPCMDPEPVLRELQQLQRQAIDTAQINAGHIVGAGIGFAGYFVREPARVNPADALRGWMGFDIEAGISSALGMPAILDNGATTGAIAESLLGVGRRCGTFAYYQFTNGFGGGLIADGKVIRGHLGNSGDFSGVSWLLGDPYPNLRLLLKTVNEYGAAYTRVEEMVRHIDLSTPGVAEWMDAVRDPLAKLTFLLGHTFAPEKVVIGGRLPRAINLALAEGIVLPRTPSRNDMAFPLPQIVASEVDGDATGIGAAMMPLRQHFFL